MSRTTVSREKRSSSKPLRRGGNITLPDDAAHRRAQKKSRNTNHRHAKR